MSSDAKILLVLFGYKYRHGLRKRYLQNDRSNNSFLKILSKTAPEEGSFDVQTLNEIFVKFGISTKSIDFHGATGPYLQYAGVRIKSILEKAKAAGIEFELSSNSSLGEAEKPLGVKILEWPGVLNRAAEHKNPTYIVTYLLELAQTWSSFYADNSVLNADSEALIKARLALASKVLEILETGLGVLGIEVPEQM